MKPTQTAKNSRVKRRLNLDLPEELYTELKRYADKQYLPITSAVRVVLNQGLARIKQRDGVI